MVKDGEYIKYSSNGKIFEKFSVLNGLRYGNEKYTDIKSGCYIIGEYYLNGFCRSTMYESCGKKIRMITLGKNSKSKKIYNELTSELSEIYDTYISLENTCDPIYQNPLGLSIFHYSDGKKSYREKNGCVLRYYKNGYEMHYYRSKNLLFY